jgi:hypothetical protein
MDLAAQIAEVDRLRVLDFPARRLHDATRRSGPGFHLAVLAADREADAEALVERLAGRWGEPEVLDLLPYRAEHLRGIRVPPVLQELCAGAPGVCEVYGWRVGDRWTAVGVGVPDGPDALDTLDTLEDAGARHGRRPRYRIVLAVGQETAVPEPAAAGG